MCFIVGGSETFVDFFPCRDYKYKFSHNDFDFGPKYNTSVLVYVYGFKTPFVITVGIVLVKLSTVLIISALKVFAFRFHCPWNVKL